ncbi:MAG: thioredoxin family protein [Prosthecobacter sp.]|nr:thioredoxin family protein [Prosthecobacter sp.]
MKTFLNSSWCLLFNLVVFSSMASCVRASDTPSANPIEVGRVSWGRDVDVGLAEAKATGKPVFLLFQEVPGCSGCQQFGREVLSEPAMVAAIEKHFVPVFIPNNKSGKDGETLKRFHEPAWNYQVVRFLDAKGQDLVPRKDGVWTARPLAERMVQALKKAGLEASPELQALAGLKVSAATTQRAAFSQSCFWTGEMKIGQIEGVVKTEAGFYDGHEVTLVDYDPAKVAFDDLVKQASAAQCADGVYVTTEEQSELAKKVGHHRISQLGSSYRSAPASDQKKQLQGTSLATLPLTPEQATKANAFVRVQPAKALEYLTPEQVGKVSR